MRSRWLPLVSTLLFWQPFPVLAAAPAAPAAEAESLDDLAARQEWEQAVRLLEAGKEQEKLNRLGLARDTALDALVRLELTTARHPSWNRPMMFRQKQECRRWILDLEERLGVSESRLWDKPGGKEAIIAAQKKRIEELELAAVAKDKRLDELAAKIQPLQQQLTLAEGIRNHGQDAILRQFQEQLDRMAAEKLTLSETLEKVTKERDQSQEQLAKVASEFEQSPRSETRLRNELVAAGLDKQRLERELQEIRARLEGLLPLINLRQPGASDHLSSPGGANPDLFPEPGTPASAAKPRPAGPFLAASAAASPLEQELRLAKEETERQLEEAKKQLQLLKLSRPLQVKDFDLIRENEQLERRLAGLEEENQRLLREAAAKKATPTPAPAANPDKLPTPEPADPKP